MGEVANDRHAGRPWRFISAAPIAALMGSKRPGTIDHPRGRSRAEGGQRRLVFVARGMPAGQGKIVDDAVAEESEAKPDLGQIPPIKDRSMGVPIHEPLPGETTAKSRPGSDAAQWLRSGKPPTRVAQQPTARTRERARLPDATAATTKAAKESLEGNGNDLNGKLTPKLLADASTRPFAVQHGPSAERGRGSPRHGLPGPLPCIARPRASPLRARDRHAPAPRRFSGSGSPDRRE